MCMSQRSCLLRYFFCLQNSNFFFQLPKVSLTLVYRFVIVFGMYHN